MPLIVGAIVLAALAIWVGITFNRLIRARNRVREAWAQIDVQLAQRADLAPRLVAAVEGYRQHEAQTLDGVVAARAQVAAAAGPADAGRADNELEGALARLYALAEAYPELKADQTFLDLQGRLTALEEDIASARRYYNALVERYATARQVFPNSLLAAPMGFRAAEYFKVGAGEDLVPEVRQ